MHFFVVNLSFSLILDNFKWKCLYDKQTHFKLLKEMVQLEKSCVNKSTSQISMKPSISFFRNNYSNMKNVKINLLLQCKICVYHAIMKHSYKCNETMYTSHYVISHYRNPKILPKILHKLQLPSLATVDGLLPSLAIATTVTRNLPYTNGCTGLLSCFKF